MPVTDQPRRFNGGQRDTLYLGSGGKCARCGHQLEPGWHAHHVAEYGKDGETDVRNGLPVCVDCHRLIHAEDLRSWQREAREKFFASTPLDYLVEAFPGTGKTRLGLSLAREMLDRGMVDRIAVVVPTDALREQWADKAAAAGLNLKPVREREDYDKAGYDGCVATYAQLAIGNGAALLRMATKAPTHAILDEIHHAGIRKAWGEGLTHALEHAQYRTALTGTPWRQDPREPIPFVRYGEDGKVLVDFEYGYGAAVADGVCRAIEFHAYDGEARWVDCGKVTSAALSAEMEDADVGVALQSALDPRHEWMPGLLKQAAAALEDLRADVPKAGGLVVGDTTKWTRDYAGILARLTNEEPSVVLSEDGREAQTNLEEYRRSQSRWLTAIRMVSEGVDIPRLAVGVYATRYSTPLFFRQVVGRFVRMTDDEYNARLYIPAIPRLMAHAAVIEQELRHQLDLEAERDRAARQTAEDQQRTFELREPIGASDAELMEVILGGTGVSPNEIAEAEGVCQRHGFPKRFARQMVDVLREQGRVVEVVTVKPKPAAEPLHRRERMLRAGVSTLSGKVAGRLGMPPGDAKHHVNIQLLKEGFPKRAKASVDDLERMRDFLARWLGQLDE